MPEPVLYLTFTGVMRAASCVTPTLALPVTPSQSPPCPGSSSEKRFWSRRGSRAASGGCRGRGEALCRGAGREKRADEAACWDRLRASSSEGGGGSGTHRCGDGRRGGPQAGGAPRGVWGSALADPSLLFPRSGDPSAKTNSQGALGRRSGRNFSRIILWGLVAGAVTSARWISLPNGCGRGEEGPAPKLAALPLAEPHARRCRSELRCLIQAGFIISPPPFPSRSPRTLLMTAPGN